MPALISEQPDLRDYRAAVTGARKAWSLLQVASEATEPSSLHWLATQGPLHIPSGGNGDGAHSGQELVNDLVRRSALEASGPTARRRYQITDDGRALHAKLSRWMHYEGCAVADWLQES